MGYWASRGLRGSSFEQLINMTNDFYRQKGLGLIEKIPTPITPTKLDNKTRTISQAFFEKKSSVDYIGVVQGIPVCFDAKETSKLSLPMQNIHKHQVDFMEDFSKQKGVAFLLVNFTKVQEIYFLPFSDFIKFYKEAENGGKKSISYESFDKNYKVEITKGYIAHYLEALNSYLSL